MSIDGTTLMKGVPHLGRSMDTSHLSGHAISSLIADRQELIFQQAD